MLCMYFSWNFSISICSVYMSKHTDFENWFADFGVRRTTIFLWKQEKKEQWNYCVCCHIKQMKKKNRPLTHTSFLILYAAHFIRLMSWKRERDRVRHDRKMIQVFVMYLFSYAWLAVCVCVSRVNSISGIQICRFNGYKHNDNIMWWND